MSDPLAGSGALGTRLLPFGVLLDQAMGWTRRHLRSVVLPLGTPLALLNALFAALQAGTVQGLVSGSPAVSSAGLAGACLLPFVALLLVAATWLVYSAVTVAAVDAAAGRPVSAARSARFLMSPAPLGTLVLTGLLTGVSYLCCIVPILYVGPLLSLTVPAMVEEDLRGMDAISRSARLTRHNPRGRFLSSPLTKAFVLFVVAFLISILLSLATSLPFQVAQQWVVARDAGAAGEAGLPPVWIFWLQVPASLMGAYVSAAAWLYASFGLALLFFDTRRRKEGPDLEEAIAALERERAARAAGGARGAAGPAGAPA